MDFMLCYQFKFQTYRHLEQLFIRHLKRLSFGSPEQSSICFYITELKWFHQKQRMQETTHH